MKPRFYILAILLFWLAFGVRAYRVADLGVQADEGVHITVAERLAAGDVLYRDLFENRTPGVEWLLAAVFRLSGADIILGRVIALGMSLLTVAALLAAGREIGRFQPEAAAYGVAAGALAALLFILAPLPIFWSRFTMLEHFETAVAALSIASGLRGLTTGRQRWWLLSGVLTGLAVLAKQSGLVLVVVWGLYLLLLFLYYSKISVLFAAGSWVTGVSLPLVGLFLSLISQGAGDDFLHFLSGVEQLGLLDRLPAKLVLLGGWMMRQPAFFLAGVGGLTALWRRHPALLLPLIWAVAEMVALLLPAELSLSWGGYSHYVIPAVTAVSLLAGSGLVWGWWVVRVNPRRWLLLGGVAAVSAVSALAWIDDLQYAIYQLDYPNAGFESEMAVGRAIASITSPDRPILVLANSVFYHRAERSPGNLFFHYPAFLPSSILATEADEDIQRVLADPDTGAVLVSRMHLEERLTPAVIEALWQRWAPTAMFSYPYQRDLFLFLPRTDPDVGVVPLATFEAGINLLNVETSLLDSTILLVGLTWSAQTRPSTDYIVFAHILGPDGEMIAQHDGQPGVGFRPTMTWADGEHIMDSHWIELPVGSSVDGKALSIGLYRSDTGERLSFRGGSTGIDSFIISQIELTQ